MNRINRLILSGIFLVLIASILISTISAKERTAEDKIDRNILQESGGGERRVIVLLKEDSSRMGVQSSLGTKKSLDSVKSRFLGARINREFTRSNGFAGSFTDEEIINLANDENVESIYEDKLLRVDLSDSTIQINATRIWATQFLGLNLTGRGQSVCIVDTGIDYTHTDFGGCPPTGLTNSGANESYTLESAHPYEDSYSYTWAINRTGFSQIALHFKNISLEYQGQAGSLSDSYDRITILDSERKIIASYHGIDGGITDLWTPFSNNGTIYVRLESDNYIGGYGFYIDQIRNGTTSTSYNWSNCSKILGGWDFVNNDGDPVDDEGHGTHVAGIVAANGAVKGVAPEANLIAIKAMNAAGDGWTSDVVAGIEWCVNQSRNYNISVISMSLGGGGFTEFCDASDPVIAEAIDGANANNIAVVVATGNNGYTDRISSPACIQNAIPVGSVRKDDLTVDYNRNSLLQLLAPGVSIYSTYPNYLGSYTTISGTSMATPHISGIFAIINQFLRMTNQTKTPQEIENSLNRTGKAVYDSGSGRYFSRVNVYESIVSFDNALPNVTLSSPLNGSFGFWETQFMCNVSDFALKNATIYIWNSSGVYATSKIDIGGNYSNLSFSMSLQDRDYVWNCFVSDMNGNNAFARFNYTLWASNLSTTLNSPADNLITNRNWTFSCNTTSGGNLTNVSLYIWNSSGIENYSFTNANGRSGMFSFSYNFTHADNYQWNCLVGSNRTVKFANSNYSLAYEAVKPILTISSPKNNSWSNGKLNVSLNENGSCWYSLDNGITNSSMTSSDSMRFSSQTSVIEGGSYNLTYFCNDSFGNINYSGMIFFNAHSIAPNVTLNSPEEGYSGADASLAFTYALADDINTTECHLIVDGAQVSSNSTALNQSLGLNSISASNSVGSHSWSINCTDEAGNRGNSSSRTFTILSSSSGSTAAGGGGGGKSTKTYTVNQDELAQTYSNTLASGDRVLFAMENVAGGYGIKKVENHTMSVDYVGTDYVRLTVMSNPIKLNLSLEEERKLNLSSSKYYDLYLKLLSIKDGKADVTMKAIYEPIIMTSKEYAKNASFEKNNSSPEATEIDKGIDRKNLTQMTMIVLLTCLILFLMIKQIIYDINRIDYIENGKARRKLRETKLS